MAPECGISPHEVDIEHNHDPCPSPVFEVPNPDHDTSSVPFESLCLQDDDLVVSSFEPFRSDGEYSEFIISDFPSNDCSRREVASFAALLPQCFIGVPMPLSELYEEAGDLSSFEEVLRLPSLRRVRTRQCSNNNVL